MNVLIAWKIQIYQEALAGGSRNISGNFQEIYVLHLGIYPIVASSILG